MSLQPTRRVRVTFVFTHHIRWVPFELSATLIDKSRFEIDYVILGTTDPMVEFLKANQIPVVTTSFDDYKNTPEAVKFVYDHLKQNKTDIVQTHWFAGSLVGLQAAYYANVPVRIFHREHPPLRFYNRHPRSKHQLIWDCATHLIAVTPKSKAGMVEDGIPADKITVIPTGFDVEEFTTLDPGRVSTLRAKYLASASYASKGPVIGVIARYVRWKGVEDVIRAFKQVLEDYPNALLILAGTHSERSEVIEKMKAASQNDIVAPQYDDVLAIFDCLDALPPGSYLEIPFEDDLYSLFQLLDIFVHAPIDEIQETFGQVYVEAMLSKIPSVITLSGSALDHAIHRDNAWISDHQNSDQIAAGIVALLRDQILRKRITENAFVCAVENYSIAKQIRILEDFYLSALEACKPPGTLQSPTI
ncbi:MAG: glycosyltransferase family 4 protein [Cyanobacteriota bacterium]